LAESSKTERASVKSKIWGETGLGRVKIVSIIGQGVESGPLSAQSGLYSLKQSAGKPTAARL
jgi:hypothetical protein